MIVAHYLAKIWLKSSLSMKMNCQSQTLWSKESPMTVWALILKKRRKKKKRKLPTFLGPVKLITKRTSGQGT